MQVDVAPHYAGRLKGTYAPQGRGYRISQSADMQLVLDCLNSPSYGKRRQTMIAPALQSILDDQASGFATHEVLNQPGALEDYNAYSDDNPLVAAVRVFGADWAADYLKRAGASVGSEK